MSRAPAVKTIIGLTAVVLAVGSFSWAQQSPAGTPENGQTQPGQSQSAKKSSKKKKQEPDGWQFRWLPRPELRYKQQLEMDFRIKTQFDFRHPDDGPDAGVTEFQWRRRRVGIEGNFLRDFQYELDVEIGEGLGLARTSGFLRDLTLNYRRFEHVELMGGRFKMPFSRDELTGPMNLNFVYRSRAATAIAPSREWGGMAHGRFLRSALRYEAGVFRDDGDNSWDGDNNPTAGATLASRLRVQPRRLFSLPGAFRTLEAGAAFTTGRINEPDGLSLRSRSASNERVFSRIPVQGRRLRHGFEAVWEPGPFLLQGEWMQAREQRLKQSIRQQDLPDLLSTGWYVQGTWVVTGERKDGGVEPRRPIKFTQWGYGAWEMAVRREGVEFRSDTDQGVPSRSPRAFRLQESSNQAWTFGVNWYWNRYIKLQGNLIREDLLPFNRPDVSPGIHWTKVFRIQFVM
jgi:phosphate-selective porin